MRILVAETKWTGHHLFFARDIASEIADSEHHVVFDVTASEDDRATDMLRSTLEDLDDRIELRRTLHGPRDGFSHLKHDAGRLEYETIQRSVREIRPDVLVLPSADALAFFMGGRRGNPLNHESTKLVLHQPYVGYAGQGWRFAIKREAIRRRLQRLRTPLAALDHRIADALGPRQDVVIIPNPPQETAPRSRSDARRTFGIPDDRMVFLAAGEHSARKGTHHLVSLWPDVPGTTLLVVGRCSGQVREAVERRRRELPADRIQVVDRVIENQTYSDAFRASDVVTVCYPSHFGASGILNTAVAFEKPVVGSDYGCIGDLIRSFGLGVAFDCSRESTMRAGLRNAVENPPRFEDADTRPLRDFMARENLGRTVRSWILGTQAVDPPPTPYPPRP